GLRGLPEVGAQGMDAQRGGAEIRELGAEYLRPAPHGMAVEAADPVQRLCVTFQLPFPELEQMRLGDDDRHRDDLGQEGPFPLGFDDMDMNRRLARDLL